MERTDLFSITVRLKEPVDQVDPVLQSSTLKTLYDIEGVVVLGEFLTLTGPRTFSLIVQAASLEAARKIYVEVGRTAGVESARFAEPDKVRSEV